MLAKAAASLDVMSGGRFELGLGAGNFWDSVAGMGGPNREFPARVEALEEAIGIIRGALDVGSEKRVVRNHGPHYPVPGYPPGPPPAHRVEVWVGAMSPRTLRLIGRLADGWVPGSGVAHVARFPELNAVIDEAAEAAGRDSSDIRRIVNLWGSITDGPRGVDPLTGPVDHWVRTLTAWAQDLKLDSFLFWPSDAGTADIERFAGEVVPAVHEAVGR
jgi:alkanesulfonate monooxygenase SsuD/methylene tetrahydromethanopterin reductase-like flavin-dependent oxidoreductase (luciferase family)